MGIMQWVNKIFCLLGLHQFKVIDITFGFGASGDVEKVECIHCGVIKTRTLHHDD